MERIINLELPTEVAYRELAGRCKVHINILPVLPGNLTHKELEVLYDIQTNADTIRVIEKELESMYFRELDGNDVKKMDDFMLSCHLHMEAKDPPHVLLRRKVLSYHIHCAPLDTLMTLCQALIDRNNDSQLQWIISSTFSGALIAKLNEKLPLEKVKEIDQLLTFPDGKRSKEYLEKRKVLLGELLDGM